MENDNWKEVMEEEVASKKTVQIVGSGLLQDMRGNLGVLLITKWSRR